MWVVGTFAAPASAIAILEIGDELCIALAEVLLLSASVRVRQGRGPVSAKICNPAPYHVSETVLLA